MTNFTKLPHKDLVSVSQLQAGDIHELYATPAALKSGRERHNGLLAGKRLAMVFEKESLRTRFTFDVGIQDLGGSAVFLDHRDARLGSRESVRDMAKNLERWVHGIVARTYKHRAVVELAQNCDIPVINGLSDFLHPCQALTDCFTLTERWGAPGDTSTFAGKTLTYVGDGNNTCHSLIHASALLGLNMNVCTPEGYEPNLKVVNEALAACKESGAELTISNDPVAAVKGVDAVYTDVWASMGQEDEIEDRAAVFADYQVTDDLMAHTRDACFMHCLPAHRGHEVTASVMDGPHSIVFDIAENRLHVQKAVLVMTMADSAVPAAQPLEVTA